MPSGHSTKAPKLVGRLVMENDKDRIEVRSMKGGGVQLVIGKTMRKIVELTHREARELIDALMVEVG